MQILSVCSPAFLVHYIGSSTGLRVGRHHAFHGTTNGICGVDPNTSTYKCIRLVLYPSLYIASPIGLIAFPVGVSIGSPALSSDWSLLL